MTTEVTILPDDVQANPLEPISPATFEIMERAQIDIQVATAKRYPRPPLEQLRAEVAEIAMVDDETAESCLFTLRRWDADEKKYKNILGASIGLAKITTYVWRNMRAGARTVGNDGVQVTAYGLCADLERNNQMFAEASRLIVDKNGRRFSHDMQRMTAAATQSIARRNATFECIPIALIRPVYEQIRKKVGGIHRRETIFKRFYAMGVDTERILAVVAKASINEVDEEDLALLIGLGTAIKDKEISVEEAFNAPAAAEPGGQEKPSKLKALRDRRAAETEKGTAE